MIQRKTFRFGARGTAANGEDIPLTAEDEQNLDAYVAKIKETVAILQKEIAAIKNGELEVVSQLFDEKSKMLKWLELRTPVIEPFVTGNIAQKLNLKGHLAELKKHIEEDGAMLSRMSVAARTILREYEKINNRNGLGGTYGKSGQKMASGREARVNIDQKL